MPYQSNPDCNYRLIQDLFLEAGRIMEDASVELALVLPRHPDEVAVCVERLGGAAKTILALANAAHALTGPISITDQFPDP